MVFDFRGIGDFLESDRVVIGELASAGQRTARASCEHVGGNPSSVLELVKGSCCTVGELGAGFRGRAEPCDPRIVKGTLRASLHACSIKGSLTFCSWTTDMSQLDQPWISRLSPSSEQGC